ncbi:MAG: HD domain-containing protein [Lachnospiraceae bacterium]|nr:HD domain-containing protein [Lachnospiraceae bacterium]
MGNTGHEYRKKYQIIRPSVITELAHGTKVSNLAFLVGKQMGFSEEMCHNLAVAGFLHDIGKLELAKYVRGHEGDTLIIEEMKYVRLHSRLGAEILESKGYSPEIVAMVKFHHENCDGSGYPMNLQREDIPIGARIIRVCDVFAALTADRPYRKAFDINTAMDLMIEESKDYDIRVFLAFMNVVHRENMDNILNTEDFEQRLEHLDWAEQRKGILAETK